LQAALVAALIGVATIGSLQMQRAYVQAWHAQLDIVRGLEEQAAAFPDGTAIVLLDVPSGPFDIRFYFPYTQLVRRFYDNSTLHVLPWQRGFPCTQQLVAFGSESAAAAVDTSSLDVVTFDYGDVVAFGIHTNGNLEPIQQIAPPYQCDGDSGDLLFEPPGNWEPAREPISLATTQVTDTTRGPANSEWHGLFARQLRLAVHFWLR
jgi:hypothetical protein